MHDWYLSVPEIKQKKRQKKRIKTKCIMKNRRIRRMNIAIAKFSTKLTLFIQ